MIARELSPVGFGALQFYIAVFFYVSFATDFGITTVGTRKYVIGPNDRLVAEVLGARILIALPAALISVIAALTLPLMMDERWTIILLATSVIAFAANLSWVLRGQQRGSALAFVDVAGSMSLLLLAALLVRDPRDVALAAGAAASMQWAMAGATILIVRKSHRVRPVFGQAATTHLLSAVPLGVATLAVTLYYNIDHVLLGFLRTPEELGLYAAAYRLVYPILGAASVLGTLALPRLVEIETESERPVVPLLKIMSSVLFLVAMPIAVGGTLVADPLVKAVFGPEYLGAGDALRILIWSALTVFANAPFGFLLLARHQDRTYMAIAIAGAMVNLLANVMLIPANGYVGAAIATLLAEIVVLVSIVLATRRASILPLFQGFATAAVPTAAMALAVWPFRDHLFAVGIGMAVYGLVLLLMRPPPVRYFLRLLSST